MNTNETINITESSVRDFKIINHKLYYIEESDGLLYSAESDGTGKQRISDQVVAEEQGWYDEIGGNVFYTTESEGGNRLFLALPEKEDEQILPEAVLKVARMNEKIVCQLAPGEDIDESCG